MKFKKNTKNKEPDENGLVSLMTNVLNHIFQVVNTIQMLNTVNTYMIANKRIPVTEKVWEELARLKRAGQSYDDLLKDLIEERKKAILFQEIKTIEEKGTFVELK